MPTLYVSRLLLRDLPPGGWPAVDALLSDAEVTRYVRFAAWDEAPRREWLAWCVASSQAAQPDAYNWAIALRPTGEVIGWLGIGGASHPATPGERGFGYALARRHWGHGYTTEALEVVLAYEFEVLGTRHITGTREVPNVASARVVDKAGMRYEGTYHDLDVEGNRALRRKEHECRVWLNDANGMQERVGMPGRAGYVSVPSIARQCVLLGPDSWNKSLRAIHVRRSADPVAGARCVDTH